jgi:hypothetical protein
MSLHVIKPAISTGMQKRVAGWAGVISPGFAIDLDFAAALVTEHGKAP